MDTASFASLTPETLALLLELKREERRRAEEERKKAEEDRRRAEVELELRQLESQLRNHSFDSPLLASPSPRTHRASPGTVGSGGACSSSQPSPASGGSRKATLARRSLTPDFGTGGAAAAADADASLVISNTVLFDMPSSCYALEFSILWKRGARAAAAAALMERGLWGRIQRVSPIETKVVAVAEVPDGQPRLIDLVNWLRQFARWDGACTGPLPPEAGRKSVMIGTCLLVDPNDGIHISTDPRFVDLLGTRLAVRSGGAASPRGSGYGGEYSAEAGQQRSPPAAPSPPPGAAAHDRSISLSDLPADPRGVSAVRDSRNRESFGAYADAHRSYSNR